MFKLFSLLLFLPLICFASVTVSGPLSYEYSGKHGEKVEGKILLHNQGAKPERVALKFYDYPYYDEKSKGYLYPEAGTDKRSNASWFTLEKNLVTIPASTTLEIPIHVEISSEKKAKGSYYSILMVEPELEAIKFDEKKPLVRSIIRYALHMITSIEGTGDYDLKILSKKVVENKEKRIFEFAVENTGTNFFRPDILIELYDESGEKVDPFKISPMWLLPTKSKTYEIDVSRLKKGKYQGLILFDQKGADFFGSNCEIEIK